MLQAFARFPIKNPFRHRVAWHRYRRIRLTKGAIQTAVNSNKGCSPHSAARRGPEQFKGLRFLRFLTIRKAFLLNHYDRPAQRVRTKC